MRVHRKLPMALLWLMLLSLLPLNNAKPPGRDAIPLAGGSLNPLNAEKDGNFETHSTTNSKASIPVKSSVSAELNDTLILHTPSDGPIRRVDTDSSGSHSIMSFISPFSNFQTPDANQGGLWRFVQGEGQTFIDRPMEQKDSVDGGKFKNLFDAHPPVEVQASPFGKTFHNFYANSPRKESAEIVYNPYTRLDGRDHSPNHEESQPNFGKNGEYQKTFETQEQFQGPVQFDGQKTVENGSPSEIPDYKIQRGHLHHYEQVQIDPNNDSGVNYYKRQENKNHSNVNPEHYDYQDEIYDYSDNDNGNTYDYVTPEEYSIINEEEFPTAHDKKASNDHTNIEKVSKTSKNKPESTSAVDSIPHDQPKNLASLLAHSKIVHVKNPSDSSSNKSSAEVVDGKSTSTYPKSRRMVPEHIKHLKNAETPEYYDYLYDEFIHMYYYDDKEDKTESATTTQENTESNAQILENTTQRSKVIKYTTASSPTSLSVPTHSTSSEVKRTTLPANVKNLPQSTTVSSQREAKDEKSSSLPKNVPTVISTPLSLSEILQELDLSLPQFLATLKTHGTSLKEFTQKLERNSISKTVFRRTKGSIKKLLDILDGTNVRNRAGSKLNKVQTTPKQTTTTHKVITANPASTSNSRSTELPKSSTAKIVTQPEVQEKSKPTAPVIFGSQPTGIDFMRPNENKAIIEVNDADKLNNMKESTSIDGSFKFDETANSSKSSKADGKSANNLSTTQSSVASSRKTTAILRPYRKTTERLRPYRPYDDNRGNPKIHRGVINSRMSSTARPTLRPPYSPKYPAIERDKESASNINPKQNDSPSKTNNFDPFKTFTDGRKSHNYKEPNENTDIKQVSAKSAIMAAAILGAVALSVFIAIFIVVKYRSHISRHKRRTPLGVPSDSSTSSIPPIYGNRAMYSRECYQTAGFWTSLKKKFDPYSPSSSPMYM